MRWEYKAKLWRCFGLSVTSDSCDPMACCRHAPLSMEFSILEWIAISFPGDLSDPKIKLRSLMSPALQVDFLPTEPRGKPKLAVLKSVGNTGSLFKISVYCN